MRVSKFSPCTHTNNVMSGDPRFKSYQLLQHIVQDYLKTGLAEIDSIHEEI